MLSKPNSSERGYALTSHSFYEARLLELTSTANRACRHAFQAPAPKVLAPAPKDRQSTPDLRSNSSKPIFHLAIEPNGWWQIREQTGTKAGLLRTRQAAIKFAREESPDGQFVIIDDIAS